MSLYYECKFCNYICSHKGDWTKHIRTSKHKRMILDNYTDNKKSPQHICRCGKKYKYKSGLSKHKKVCSYRYVDERSVNNISSNTIVKLLEENIDLRQKIIEQQETHYDEIMKIIPKIGNTTNKFNLNIFLNEQCKDAINWDEFIKSINVNMADMESLIDANITSGITNVLCNSINELGIYKRPIHCIDVKRKKICIKNKNAWEYDPQKNKNTMERYNKQLHYKHIEQLKQWQENNPSWEQNEELRDKYIKLTQKVVDNVNDDKCLHEIVKFASIPKELSD